MKTHIKRSSLENCFLFPYQQTKKGIVSDFSRLENNQFFPYFSRLRRKPATGALPTYEREFDSNVQVDQPANLHRDNDAKYHHVTLIITDVTY